MLNEVKLIGNIGMDAEINTLESGVKVAQISLATSETYKDANGETQTKTSWHRVVAWRGLAEVLEKYTSKGSKLYVSGKLETRTYQDQSGIDRYITEVIANKIILLDSKSKNAVPPPSDANVSSAKVPSVANAKVEDEDDDLPF